MPKVRGDSGTDMTQVTDDKVTIVGSSPNLYPSCRVDGAGKSKVDISSSESEGMMEMETARSEYEVVDNSGDHHGGAYTIVAMNKFSVDAAGGGISLNTGGNVSIMAGGGLINMTGTEAVNAIARTVSFTASETTTGGKTSFTASFLEVSCLEVSFLTIAFLTTFLSAFFITADVFNSF